MRNINYLPLIFLFLVVCLLDWYVFQGVKSLGYRLNAQAQLSLYSLFWGISFVVFSVFITTIYTYIRNRKLTVLFNIVFNSFLTLFTTKLVFALILALEDVYRLALSIFIQYPPRSHTWGLVALTISAIPFFAFIFGVTRGKYHYKVHRIKVFFDNLPESFNGFTISQISDVHSGSLDNIKGVQRGIDLINRQQADLFVFTGDLVNNQATEIEPWIPLFSQIKAKYGKFSVLGNHDYGDYIQWSSQQEKAINLKRLRDNHTKIGFKLLLDEHVTIQKDGDAITLVGIENWGVGFGQRGNLNKALSGSDAKSVKILLSHDPSHWDAEVKKHPAYIHLTLSGHTHGMQFGIEVPGFKWSPVKYRYPNWAGLTKEGGRYLYVNRGFGFLGFSGRVGIWPEITVIELCKSG